MVNLLQSKMKKPIINFLSINLINHPRIILGDFFLTILKNIYYIIVGLAFFLTLLFINTILYIANIDFKEFFINFFNNSFYNVLFMILIYCLIFYPLSLLNYLKTSRTFTNFFSLIIALFIGSIHGFLIYKYNNVIDIESYLVLLSCEIFLSFFINYSCKYEK